MLNIPDSVKALFKLDNVKKNFRVQFPNGEFSDLTNNDIVLGSVRFTESVCSQASFRFGLAERSVIEFETVGVGNMRGMTIKCSCEICIDSLSAAQIEEIRTYDGDGTYYEAPAATALGWRFYRIPYGVFVVAECPRNQEARVRRTVRAYSPNDYTVMSPFESAKLQTVQFSDAQEPTYTPDTALLAYGLLSYFGDDVLLDEGFSKTEITQRTSMQLYPNFVFPTIQIYAQGSYRYTIELRGIETYGCKLADQTTSDDAIFGISGAGSANYLDWDTQIRAQIRNLVISYPVSAYFPDFTYVGQIKSEDEFVEILTTGKAYLGGIERGNNVHFANRPYYYFEEITGSASIPTEKSAPIDTNIETSCVYPGGRNDNAWNANFLLPRSFDLRITDNTTGTTNVVQLRKSASDFSGVKFWKYTAPQLLPFLGNKLQFSGNRLGDGDWYDFAGVYNPADIIRGYMEICAKFVAPKRTGGTRIFRLPSTFEEMVLPSLYERAEWDETLQTQYGVFRFPYKVNGRDQIAVYRFGYGLGIYDVLDNAVLSAISTNPNNTGALLYSNMAPYLSLAPAGTEIDRCMALPYLEAGDLIAVRMEDGSMTQMYITRQELTGEMFIASDLQEASSSTL